MGLSEENIIEILQGVKESNVLSIHLSGNYFTDCDKMIKILKTKKGEKSAISVDQVVKEDVH